MIGRLTGELLQCGPQEVVLDVGGVGYLLRIPLSTFYAVSGRSNGRVSLHVHTHVREDALLLFGFATSDERSAFELLISISGVGPRIALAVLSGIGVAELEHAVETGDRARLERIPGIGRKTAERILLELRGRMERASHSGSAEPPEARGTASRTGEQRGTRSDAVSALVNLGYPRDAAGRAVDAALADTQAEVPLEDVLRNALRGLLR